MNVYRCESDGESLDPSGEVLRVDIDITDARSVFSDTPTSAVCGSFGPQLRGFEPEDKIVLAQLPSGAVLPERRSQGVDLFDNRLGMLTIFLGLEMGSPTLADPLDWSTGAAEYVDLSIGSIGDAYTMSAMFLRGVHTLRIGGIIEMESVRNEKAYGRMAAEYWPPKLTKKERITQAKARITRFKNYMSGE